MESIDKLKKLIARKEQFIATKEGRLSAEVFQLEKEILEILMAEYVPKLQTDASGQLIANEQNLALITELDGSFEKFYSLHADALSKVSEDLIKMTSFSAKYYVEGLGYARQKIDSLVQSLNLIEKAIGIKSGKFIKGSFIDSLVKAPEVKRKIKKYIIESIAARKPMREFSKGLRELIVGTDKTDGRLQKYYKQYIYDLFNKVDAIVSKHIADELGLKHFLYAGTIIKSSRKFCIKRAGKVFHIDDTKTWKDDPDLIDKSTKESYNPLIERGRYNCRHIIMYITEELAIKWGYKHKKSGLVMSKIKPIEERIPALYRRSAIDQMMFAFVQGCRKTLVTLTIQEGIKMFMETYGLTDDDYPVETARTTFFRMQKEYISLFQDKN